MPETDEDVQAETAAAEIAAGTDKIWIPIEFLQENIPPPKAPLPALSVQIGRMTVTERVKLALQGGKEARIILSHDSNKVVRRYVLHNPRITDGEVASIVNSKMTDEEQIRIIADKKEWLKNYATRLGLVRNPKTPLIAAVNMLPTLRDYDLGRLAKSRDVPEGVVHHARRIYLERRERKTSHST